jgi:hypothetical protein
VHRRHAHMHAQKDPGINAELASDLKANLGSPPHHLPPKPRMLMIILKVQRQSASVKSMYLISSRKEMAKEAHDSRDLDGNEIL